MFNPLKKETFNQNCKKEGRKEMLYLTTHSTHFIYGYMVSDHKKNHSDSEKENPLPPHRLLFPISSKGYFYMHHPTYRITHTTAFVTPVVEHWMEREIAHSVHHEGSIRRPIAPWANAHTTSLWPRELCQQELQLEKPSIPWCGEGLVCLHYSESYVSRSFSLC